MSTKYHTRDHYEIVLMELMKLAEGKEIDVRLFSDMELLIQINNHLAYFNVETYTLEEMEMICSGLSESKVNVA